MVESCTDSTPLLYSLSDTSLSASSTHGSYSPSVSRLHNLLSQACWASGPNQPGEYIQADLLQVYVIQGFAARGRGDGHTQFVTSFKFATSVDGATFDTVQLWNGQERIFLGNTDATGIVSHSIDSTDAQFVRLIAMSWTNHISLRWEVYACVSSCE